MIFSCDFVRWVAQRFPGRQLRIDRVRQHGAEAVGVRRLVAGSGDAVIQGLVIARGR